MLLWAQEVQIPILGGFQDQNAQSTSQDEFSYDFYVEKNYHDRSAAVYSMPLFIKGNYTHNKKLKQ